MPTRHIAAHVAEFIVGYDASVAPPSTVGRAVRLFADAIACGVGARQVRWGENLHRAAFALGTGIQTTADGPVVLAGDAPGGMATTAGVNASLVNCLDYDDTHFGHPGAVVVPVALAVGHGAGSSRDQLIEAVMVGYEIAGKVAAATNPSRSARNVAWGTGLRFAPAAAGVAGKLLGLDGRRLAHALALAACDGPVPSVRQAVYSSGGPSMGKNNYAASATAGVTAAFLAQEGITGPLDIFDSTGGFASLTGTDQWQPAELTSDRVHVNEVESKPYPCCRKIHASLDALRELQRRHGFSHDDVLAVTLASSGWSAGDCFANPRPQQIVDVQFSARFCSALVMHGVPTGVDWFTPTVLSNEAVHATSRKVQLKAPSNAMPAETHSWWTEVEVRTTSGMHGCAVSTPKGSPGNPMTDEELHTKFSSLVAPVLGPDRATNVYEAVVGRNSNVDARGLSALLAMNTSAPV